MKKYLKVILIFIINLIVCLIFFDVGINSTINYINSCYMPPSSHVYVYKNLFNNKCYYTEEQLNIILNLLKQNNKINI